MNQPQTDPFPARPVHALHAGEAAPRWEPDSDEPVLGWECAYPALQIEQWGQDGGPPALY